MTEAARKLVVDGVTLDLRVERKRVKNINARLRGSTLLVSAPRRVTNSELLGAAKDLARQLLRRARAEAVNGSGSADAIARKVAARFPKPPRVNEVRFVTTQKASWGSYSSRTGIVRVNAALRLMPPWVLESVLAHELAHSFYLDHSPAFWRLVRSVCRHTDRANAFLEGVSWMAASWEDLPPVERRQLVGRDSD